MRTNNRQSPRKLPPIYRLGDEPVYGYDGVNRYFGLGERWDTRVKAALRRHTDLWRHMPPCPRTVPKKALASYGPMPVGELAIRLIFQERIKPGKKAALLEGLAAARRAGVPSLPAWPPGAHEGPEKAAVEGAAAPEEEPSEREAQQDDAPSADNMSSEVGDGLKAAAGNASASSGSVTKLTTKFKFEDIEFHILNMDGDPLFNRLQVCRALGLENTTNAVRGLDADEQILIDTASWQVVDIISLTKCKGYDINELLADGSNRYQWHLTEPGLYHLIRNSRKPAGIRLRRFVDHDVLPSIRKTGSYGMVDPMEMLKSNPSQLFALLTESTRMVVAAQAETAEERKARQAAEEKTRAEVEGRRLDKIEADKKAATLESEKADLAAELQAVKAAYIAEADDDQLMVLSKAAMQFQWHRNDFFDWLETGPGHPQAMKWRRKVNGKKEGPGLATDWAVDQRLMVNKFRPYSVPPEYDENGVVTRPGRTEKKMQAFLTLDGYLWLHRVLPQPPHRAQGNFDLPPNAPLTRH